MKTRNRAKINIPMFLAGILLCLTLFSLHLTGGLYAKYTTSGSGTDSARVISFGNLTLTESGDFTSKIDSNNNEYKEFIITPGVDLEKKALLNFSGSESATYVFVSLDNTGWTISDDGTTYTKYFGTVNDPKRALSWSVATKWSALDKDKYPGVYLMTLAPNTELDNVSIIFNNTVYVGENIIASDLKDFSSLSIDIQAFVVQSGGFDSAAAAWESVSKNHGKE